jgi:succinate dehydrogenase/fumarate reductase flavoprotein subunit
MSNKFPGTFISGLTSGADNPTEWDFVILGSGAGALTAAIRAAKSGLKVLVIEKSQYLGGTSAWSGGNIWVPNNAHMKAAEIADSREQALMYAEAIIGTDAMQREMVERYIDQAPIMSDFVESHTEVDLTIIGDPDYHPEVPGATSIGRGLLPVAYDGRRLGRRFNLLRPCLPELTVLGGMMFDLNDLAHMMSFTRSPKSWWHCFKMFARYARDRIGYPRGTRLTFGNALAAALIKSAFDAGISFCLETAGRLLFEGGEVKGVSVESDGKKAELYSRYGVLLATGGYAYDVKLRDHLLKYSDKHLFMIVESNQGDGINDGLAQGAQLGECVYQNAFGYPTTCKENADGSTTKMMLMLNERNKPGSIIVNSKGERFVDEAGPYNEFYHAQIESDSVPAYLICDHATLRKNGLGLLRPGPSFMRPLSEFLKSGYFTRASSIRELAEKLGIDADGLEETVAKTNRFAETGKDTDFARGESYYDRFNGDPDHKPNPNLGPIYKPPFYAVKIYPGSTATCAGLVTDTDARVLDSYGDALPGLYACGLDMRSPFSGHALGPGCSLGPAMTFGFLAASDVVKRAGR